jgi:hypothetical protein
MTDGAARVVVDRYRLARPLGRGGMGAVWQAHDTLLDRDVAIKEIWFPSAGNGPVDPADPLIRRALREAQAAARLRHPGIVTVHDVVTDEGRPWIVMELVSGQTLAEAIREHGLLTERRTAEIGLLLLDALRAAHRAGIVHRDVKPANILLDDDRVVLTDFGIAAINDATALTATGQMVGSPAYLAPERINGRPATAAGDLWAVGVTLYAALTGRSPFQRDDAQATFAAILTSRPHPPAHAGRLWPVIKGLLAKDPDRRLTTDQAMTLLATAVDHAADAASARPAPARRWWPAQSRRHQFTQDGLPGTVAAPPPTIAAPTAQQDPPRPQPPQSARGPQPAPAQDRAGSTAETDAAGTDAGETMAAETVTAGTVAGETVVGEAVAAKAEIPASVLRTPFTTPRFEAAIRPRAARARAVWLAAVTVGVVLGAGGILRAFGPEADDTSAGRESAAGNESVVAASGASPAGSAGARAQPAASISPAASTPVNRTLDPCLVGTWQMTSIQVINHFEGVDARFTGTGGMIMRIEPDGSETDEYNKSAPLKATIKGARYVETLHGYVRSRVQTRNGRIYNSERFGYRLYEVTRNGKRVEGGKMTLSAEPLPYICTETTLTTYGGDDASTQSFKRLDNTP